MPDHPVPRSIGAGYARAVLARDFAAIDTYRTTYTADELLESLTALSQVLIMRVAAAQEMCPRRFADALVSASAYLDEIADGVRGQ